MKIELTRFKVKAGKSKRVDEWMQLLKDNHEAVLETLEGEKMCVEAIFREKKGEEEYLYWFSIQGENPRSVLESKYDIDQKHMEFWKECMETAENSSDWRKDMDLQAFFKAKKLDLESLYSN